MLKRPFHSALLACAIALALAGCTRNPAPSAVATPVAEPSTGIQPTVVARATVAASPPLATAAPSNEPSVEASAAVLESAAAPTVAPVSVVGETVLQLAAGEPIGNGPAFGQIISFRIGADGSLRLLDAGARRVLFFDASGGYQRSLEVAEASEPIDFIVAGTGEVFVLDRGGGNPSRVLRYNLDGGLREELPISYSVASSADGIALSAELEGERGQDLVLTQGIERFWFVRHFGELVPPNLQTLTGREGTMVPRSPVFFTNHNFNNRPVVRPFVLTAGITSDMIVDAVDVPIELPLGARFFNIDNAMNLYLVRGLDGSLADAVEVWRVDPEGTVLGGARVDYSGCNFSSWRQFYVDQAGTAWSLCASEQGVEVRSHALLDATGRGLPPALEPPDDLNAAWQPGQRFSAA